MLPAELVYDVCGHLDISSVRDLSLSCKFWRQAIDEDVFKQVMLKNCPWFEPDSNSLCKTWKECVIVYTDRQRRDFDEPLVNYVQSSVWPCHLDEPLPSDFYRFSHPPATQTGDDLEGLYVDFSVNKLKPREIEGIPEDPFVFTSDHDIEMRMDMAPLRSLISVADTKEILAILSFLYEDDQRKDACLMVKFRDSEGVEPDIKLPFNSNAIAPEYVKVFACGKRHVFLYGYDKKLHYVTRHGSHAIMDLPIHDVTEGFVCYDGLLRFWTEDGVTYAHGSLDGSRAKKQVSKYRQEAQLVSQDVKFPNYAVMSNLYGVRGLLDMTTPSYMIISKVLPRSSAAAFVGISGGQPGIWCYSYGHVDKLLDQQHPKVIKEGKKHMRRFHFEDEDDDDDNDDDSDYDDDDNGPCGCCGAHHPVEDYEDPLDAYRAEQDALNQEEPERELTEAEWDMIYDLSQRMDDLGFPGSRPPWL